MSLPPTSRLSVASRELHDALFRTSLAVLTALSVPLVGLLSASFLVGQVCDVLTTHAALATGRYREANPLFASVLSANELLGLVVKLGVAGLVLLAAMTKLSGRRRTAVLGVLAFVALEAPASNALHMLGVL